MDNLLKNLNYIGTLIVHDKIYPRFAAFYNRVTYSLTIFTKLNLYTKIFYSIARLALYRGIFYNIITTTLTFNLINYGSIILYQD